MDMGPMPQYLEAPPIQRPLAEVEVRVALLESNTGLHLPDAACALLHEQSLDSVNRFFFDNAVKDPSIEGWQAYKIKSQPRQAISQRDLEYYHRVMQQTATRHRDARIRYTQMQTAHAKQLGMGTTFNLALLEPVIGLGYVVKDITPESVTLATPPIILVHEGHRYKMGRYKVTVGNGSIKVTTYSGGYSSGGYRHPHVTRGGDVCWGTAHQPYVDYINTGNPVEALIALLQVLKSYNHGSPYHSLYHWIPVCMDVAWPDKDWVIRQAIMKEGSRDDRATWSNLMQPDSNYFIWFKLYTKDQDTYVKTVGYQYLDGKLTMVDVPEELIT